MDSHGDGDRPSTPPPARSVHKNADGVHRLSIVIHPEMHRLRTALALTWLGARLPLPLDWRRWVCAQIITRVPYVTVETEWGRVGRLRIDATVAPDGTLTLEARDA